MTRILLTFGVACLVVTAACSEPVRLSNAPARPIVRAGARPSADAGVDGAADGGRLARVYRDNDFVELGTVNRDPFRDYVVSLGSTGVVENPRTVKMRDISLDQMRLIAVITGVPVPYAMIEDPSHVGHWIVRGDYIGRDDVVNAGGAEGMPIALNWRVDRIRDGEVVLTREDPLHPDQPPLMRSMSLRDRNGDEEAQEGVRTGVLNNTGVPAAATSNGAAPTPGAATAPTPPTTTTTTNQPRSSDGTTNTPGQNPPTTPTPPSTPPPTTGGTTGSTTGSTRSSGGFGPVFSP